VFVSSYLCSKLKELLRASVASSNAARRAAQRIRTLEAAVNNTGFNNNVVINNVVNKNGVNNNGTFSSGSGSGSGNLSSGNGNGIVKSGSARRDSVDGASTIELRRRLYALSSQVHTLTTDAKRTHQQRMYVLATFFFFDVMLFVFMLPFTLSCGSFLRCHTLTTDAKRTHQQRVGVAFFVLVCKCFLSGASLLTLLSHVIAFSFHYPF
jgi:hypothetical protein